MNGFKKPVAIIPAITRQTIKPKAMFVVPKLLECAHADHWERLAQQSISTKPSQQRSQSGRLPTIPPRQHQLLVTRSGPMQELPLFVTRAKIAR